MHPLRKLRESGTNTPAAVGKLLAEQVVFHSPVLVRAVGAEWLLPPRWDLRSSG